MLCDLSSKTDTLAEVKHYIADLSVFDTPQCFMTNDGGGFTSASFSAVRDEPRTGHEYTAPDTLKHNAVV